jgi:hypothetical protein
MNEKEGAATAVSRSEGHINRRVGLRLVAAGIAAALLPYPSRAETLGESLPSIHPERKVHEQLHQSWPGKLNAY